MSDKLTLEEQEKILLVADGLLAEPGSWVQGKWKCPLYTTGSKGLAPKCDINGQPLYGYCIQGAVNQAAVDVLGPARAELMGVGGLEDAAAHESEEAVINYGRQGNGVASALGLDEVAYELYAKDLRWTPEVKEAHGPGNLVMHFNDTDGTPGRIKKILRTRLKQVRSAMGKEK